MKNPKIQVNVPVKVDEEYMTINGKKTSVYKSVDKKQHVFSAEQIKKALGIQNIQLDRKIKLLYNDYLASNDAVSSIEEMKVFSIECRNLLVNSASYNVVTNENSASYNVVTNENSVNDNIVSSENSVNDNIVSSENSVNDNIVSSENSVRDNICSTDEQRTTNICSTDEQRTTNICSTDKTYKPYKVNNVSINLFSAQTVYYLVKAIQKTSKKTNVKLNTSLLDLESFLLKTCKVKKITHNEHIYEMNKLREQDVNFNNEFRGLCLKICPNLEQLHFRVLFNMQSLYITTMTASNFIAAKIDGNKINGGMTVNKPVSLANLKISRNYHDRRQSIIRQDLYGSLLPMMRNMYRIIGIVSDPEIFINKINQILANQCDMKLLNYTVTSRKKLDKKIKEQLNIYNKNQLVFKEQLKLTTDKKLKGKTK